MEKEAKLVSRNKQYNFITKTSRKTKEFLKQNDLSCMRSDKTNRLVICRNDTVIKQTDEILNEENTYERMEISKFKSLEAQANKLIKAAVSGSTLAISKYQKEKLIACNSQPANMFTFVKYHKNMNSRTFPLRPIASVHGTPVDKIDWCISKILVQILKYIPSHQHSVVPLISSLKNIDLTDFDQPIFISLDVHQLYPSIPILLGIEYNMKSICEHYDKIDNYNIKIQDIEKMLKFICFNYEVQNEGKV